ncbi:MAG: ribbon-helix-helix domain-containing protein [Xanthobacteraceae bacterium]
MFTKHSIHIGERAISVSMEEEFWNALRDIAADRNTTLSALLREIAAKVDGTMNGRRLASALRVYILEQITSVNPPTTPRIHRKKRPVVRSY